MMVSFRNFQRIHLVGIGGIASRRYALRCFYALGYSVSRNRTPKLSHKSRSAPDLGGHGLRRSQGFQRRWRHVVVTSSAVKEDNPESHRSAHDENSRDPAREMLAELMRLKYGIAVAGAARKTTTTSIVASVLAGHISTPRLWSAGESTRQAQRPRIGKGRILCGGSGLERSQLPDARAGGWRW